MTSERTSHDQLFKELLHRFLAEFVRVFFPDIAAHLDFATLRFVEGDLIFNFPNQATRIPDIVAEADTINGETKTIIIHIEVENRNISTLPARLYEYSSLLRFIFQRDILSIAFYPRHNAGGVGWREHKITIFGETVVRFRYPQVGLRGLSSEDYLTDHPLAAALAALMKPRKKHLGEVKLSALETVIASGLTVGDKLFLIKMMETYVPTSTITDTSEVIMEQLVALETTWVDEALARGHQQGREEGREEGRKVELTSNLLRLLRRKFGELPTSLTSILEGQSFVILDQLFDDALDVETLADFSARLEAKSASDTPSDL